MSVSYKVENVSISAVRDRAMFNSFAGDNDYVIEGIGNELQVLYDANSFVVELQNGEAVIKGGSMLAESTTSLTLSANTSGYLVIEIDLSQTGDNICQFKAVPSIVQNDINNGGFVYDFVLGQFSTDSLGVSSYTDQRKILATSLSDELSSKQDKLVSGTNIKTVRNASLLGSGNIDVGITAINDLTASRIGLMSGTGVYIASKNSSSLEFSNSFVTLASPNLNNIKYHYMGYVTNATNIPSFQSVLNTGILIVISNREESVVKQIYTPSDSDYIFMRRYINNAWSSWVQIPSSQTTLDAMIQEYLNLGSPRLFWNYDDPDYEASIVGITNAGNTKGSIFIRPSDNGGLRIGNSDWLYQNGQKRWVSPTDLDAKTTSSLTMNSLFTTVQTNSLVKRGHTVEMTLRFAVPTGTETSGLQIGTIPDGYRPSVAHYTDAYKTWASTGYPVAVNSSGAVTFLNTAYVAGQSYVVHDMYFVD